MLSKEDFYRLVKPETKFKIKDIEFELVPNMGDLLFFIPVDPKMDQKDIKKLQESKMDIVREIFKRSIKAGTFPEVPEKDLEMFLCQNFGDISNGLMKCYGGVSEEDMSDIKKKQLESLALKKD